MSTETEERDRAWLNWWIAQPYSIGRDEMKQAFEAGWVAGALHRSEMYAKGGVRTR